jgi:hypothetical protein
MKIHPLSQGGL